MALDVYFKDDIAQGIAAVCAAMLSTAVAHGGTNVEYCRGVIDFARAQALNYGLSWPVMVRLLSTELGTNNTLLDLVERALPAGG